MIHNMKIHNGVGKLTVRRGIQTRHITVPGVINLKNLTENASRATLEKSPRKSSDLKKTITKLDSAKPSRMVKVASFNPSDEPLPRLVIIGGGWGSTYLLKKLKPFIYNTTLVSMENYFLFTPLLPEASSGTLEPECIVEGFRRICSPSGAYFVEAQAKDVDFDKKVIKAISTAGENIEVPYDFLVISVGATVNTFGIPGVAEHATFLKTIDNSMKIRKKILSNFERAEISDSDIEKKRLLTFVVCGAGPTGVECIAGKITDRHYFERNLTLPYKELYDLIYKDLIHYYPTLVEKHVTLKLIEGADRILLAMTPDTSSKCCDHIKDLGIDIHLNTLVSEIDSSNITCRVKNPTTGESNELKIAYGLCIWSGGVGPSPLTKTLCEKLYPGKRSRGLVVENNLVLRGSNNVFALGDCATFDGPSLDSLFNEALGDMTTSALTYTSFYSTFKKVIKSLPYKNIPSSKIKTHFTTFDSDGSEKLEQGELQNFFKAMNIRYTTLAPTAQVASQQGEFLGKALSKSIPEYNDSKGWMISTKSIPQFKYNHTGVFSYIGCGKSVLELDSSRHFVGRFAFFVWKFTYLVKQVSYRNSYSVLMEWLKSAFFGRSVSHF